MIATQRAVGALLVRPTVALERERPLWGEPAPILERAMEQHEVLLKRLQAAGFTTKVVAADSVAIDDLALLFDDGAFLLRPSALERRPEIAALEGLLAEAKIPILGRIEAPGLLDGGDVLQAGRVLFVGVPQDRPSLVGIPKPLHGNAAGRAQLASFAAARGLEIREVPFSADVRRLRSVAALLDAQTLLYGPRLVDGAAFGEMRRIELPAGEEYGAGVFVLGPHSVLANLRFRSVLPLLRKAGYRVDAIDLWEFVKVGITPASLAFPLKKL